MSDPRDDRSKSNGIPYMVTDDAFVPSERYYSPEFFELENEKLWPHVWQMACRLEEIPEVGDFVEYSIARYSILVVRTGPDEVKAYENSCRHRGTQLVEGCGRLRNNMIACPFHGWRWNLDGTPIMPLYGCEGFEERVMDPEDLALNQCQVGFWAGCVFINMDLAGPPLSEFMDSLPNLLDPLLVGNMRVYWWKTAHLRANWKLALEAFMEGWHAAFSHPELTMHAGANFPPNFLSVQSSFPHGHASLAHGDDSAMHRELTGEAERTLEFLRITNDLLDAMVLEKDIAAVETLRNVELGPGEFGAKMIEALYDWNRTAGITLPAPDPTVLARWGSQWFVFPNFSIHPLYGNAIAYRARPDPNDPESCYFDVWSLTLFPDDDKPTKPVHDGVRPGVEDSDFFPLILRQDYANLERMQRGVRNPHHRAQRLGLKLKWEQGISSSHAHLDTYLAK